MSWTWWSLCVLSYSGCSVILILLFNSAHWAVQMKLYSGQTRMEGLISVSNLLCSFSVSHLIWSKILFFFSYLTYDLTYYDIFHLFLLNKRNFISNQNLWRLLILSSNLIFVDYSTVHIQTVLEILEWNLFHGRPLPESLQFFIHFGSMLITNVQMWLSSKFYLFSNTVLSFLSSLVINVLCEIGETLLRFGLKCTLFNFTQPGQ